MGGGLYFNTSGGEILNGLKLAQNQYEPFQQKKTIKNVDNLPWIQSLVDNKKIIFFIDRGEKISIFCVLHNYSCVFFRITTVLKLD